MPPIEFPTSMWNIQRIGRAHGVLLVLNDPSLELIDFCLGKTLRCGKQTRTHKEMSWLNVRKKKKKKQRCECV